MGGWVGGWVEEIEEIEAVRMRCCGLCMGGWVGGWIGRRDVPAFQPWEGVVENAISPRRRTRVFGGASEGFVALDGLVGVPKVLYLVGR